VYDTKLKCKTKKKKRKDNGRGEIGKGKINGKLCSKGKKCYMSRRGK
jgi:hypothetical protein